MYLRLRYVMKFNQHAEESITKANTTQSLATLNQTSSVRVHSRIFLYQ